MGSRKSKKVAYIYADSPVLDGSSWPDRKGEGVGSKADWQNFKKVYGIASEAEIAHFKGNSIYKTEVIAKVGFPIIYFCGIADNVVVFIT